MNRIIKAIGGRSVLAMLCLAIGFGPGCGGGPSGPDATASTATGQVKGKVTWQGKPLTNIEVKFNPSNLNRPNAKVVIASTKEDGSYELTTLVGQNQVALSGAGTSKSPQISYYTKTFDVKAGMNDLDIAIP